MKRIAIIICLLCIGCVTPDPRLEKVFSRVKDHVVCVIDQTTPWRHYADEIEHGQIVSTNCVGFAMTCAELLVRSGIPAENVWLAKCRTETGQLHMVCIVDGWLLDNRQNWVWQYTEIGYTWLEKKAMKDEVWESVK